MSSQTAISIDRVSKKFKLPHERISSVKSAFINFYRHNRSFEMQEALTDVSFEIIKGEFFGIVGRNGSGKSTLLKILAGIYNPTEGSVQIDGSLTPFIELGVGFNPELTGRENVFLNGALLGFSRRQVRAMYHDIVSFAELEKFMDQKLKNYSSGMQVRLAFSIAIRSKSDILLIDEVLAVGDAAFQQKCYDYFRQLKKDKKTVIFVSHDLASVENFCDRAAIIDGGKLKDVGGAKEIVKRYETILADSSAGSANKKRQKRPGTGECTIENVKLLNASGKAATYIDEGQAFKVAVSIKSKTEGNVVIGLAVMDDAGVTILGPNTEEGNVQITVKKNGSRTIQAEFRDNKLTQGGYSLTAGVFSDVGLVPLDYFENALTFKILGERRHGKINAQPNWTIS